VRRPPLLIWGLVSLIWVFALGEATCHPRPTPTPNPTPFSACPADPVMGVYHSSRLVVQKTCVELTGIVYSVRHELDGDYHIDVTLDQAGYTNAVNDSDQHGALVTEIMPGQSIPVPTIGERVDVLGTWALDSWHGWLELHPVFCVNDVCSLPVVPPTYGGE
jgi:hypothetical protein